MLIEIKNRYSDKIIYSGEHDTIRDAVMEAVKSGANLCDANLYGANLYGANLYDANLRNANLCGANLCDANLYGANLCDANLYDANLRNANLCGANLYGANLRGSNLYGANLRGANLYDANLYGALGIGLSVFVCGSKHNLWYYDGKIKIGCEYHNVNEWLANYETIGKANDYTDKQITEYKKYIDFCTSLKIGDENVD